MVSSGSTSRVGCSGVGRIHRQEMALWRIVLSSVGFGDASVQQQAMGGSCTGGYRVMDRQEAPVMSCRIHFPVPHD